MSHWNEVCTPHWDTPYGEVYSQGLSKMTKVFLVWGLVSGVSFFVLIWAFPHETVLPKAVTALLVFPAAVIWLTAIWAVQCFCIRWLWPPMVWLYTGVSSTLHRWEEHDPNDRYLPWAKREKKVEPAPPPVAFTTQEGDPWVEASSSPPRH